MGRGGRGGGDEPNGGKNQSQVAGFLRTHSEIGGAKGGKAKTKSLADRGWRSWDDGDDFSDHAATKSIAFNILTIPDGYNAGR